jgi:hypothetical protein
MSSGSTASSLSGHHHHQENQRLCQAHLIAAMQDEIQLTLSRYIETAHPTQPFRFGKLLLLLPSLRSVDPATIEEIYFRPTIGDIPLGRIVADMLTSPESTA